jgi:UDP:flavonoid glycosyltransferase YjiC (YdhE family)
MGITQRALGAGVPVCVVPFGRDQLEVAGHVTACGAGTRVAVQRLRADRLRAAVRGAIAKRAGAQRIASAFASVGGAPAGADALEALANVSRLQGTAQREPAIRSHSPAYGASARMSQHL